MIKKLLFSFALVASIGLTKSIAQSTCTPDLTCLPGTATQGICPDSTMGIPSGIISSPYTVTMSIKIPATTVSGSTTYNLTHFAVTDVLIDITNTGTYVPLTSIGLDYLGSGTNIPSGPVSGPSGVTMTKFCYWNAPSNGCVVVSGTPNTVGSFPIRIISQARALILTFGVWQAAPDNNDYVLVINNAASIETLNLSKFDVDQNSPNPFAENSEIRFSSVDNSNVEFKVFNMLGANIYNKNIKAAKGINSIKIEANSFAPGVYIYSITSGDKTITKRMVVASK